MVWSRLRMCWRPASQQTHEQVAPFTWVAGCGHGADALGGDEVGLADQSWMREVPRDDPLVGAVPPQHLPPIALVVVGALAVPNLSQALTIFESDSVPDIGRLDALTRVTGLRVGQPAVSARLLLDHVQAAAEQRAQDRSLARRSVPSICTWFNGGELQAPPPRVVIDLADPYPFCHPNSLATPRRPNQHPNGASRCYGPKVS